MLTLIFGNKSKEDALAMRDLFCSSVKGIPGYIENEILITSQLTKSDGTPEFDFGIDCSDQDMTKYLDILKNLKG